MRLLLSEAQFLVDTKVKEALATLPEGEAELAQVESMLRALGVESEAEVDALLAYFFPHGSVEEGGVSGAADEEEEEGGEPEALRELKRLISPESVVRAISAFVAAKKADKFVGGTKLAKSVASEPVPQLQRKDPRREEREFWARGAEVIGKSKLVTWIELEKALGQYNKVLVDRADAIEEVGHLEEKNRALKGLLQTYLGARVNEELIIPPNKTIRMGV